MKTFSGNYFAPENNKNFKRNLILSGKTPCAEGEEGIQLSYQTLKAPS